MHYRQRKIEMKFKEYLKSFPVVGITGPRQSGKSTFLLNVLPKYRYVTFDDLEQVALFEDDPKGYMQEYNNRVIFDEAQKVPKLFNYVKIAVDQDRNNYGKFVLTGSSQFHLLQKISESLAGRIGLLSLLPYQYAEMPKQKRDTAIYKGSYPELVERDYSHSHEWYTAYIDTYLHKDLRDIAQIGNLRDFQRLISLLAARTSQVLNLTSYARDIGVSVPTIKHWISVLEASYIIFLLPPYHGNHGKRIIKTPKCYFYDTGLVAYLTGILTEELYEKGPLSGPLFENYIISEIIKREKYQTIHSNFYYYRTSHGLEVDLIIDRKTHKEFIEIKKTATFRPQMAKAIKSMLEKNDKGYVLYNGEQTPYSSNIKIINYKDYLD